MKKELKITIIILIMLSILGYGVFRILNGPSISMKDKRDIKNCIIVNDVRQKK